MFPNGMMLFNPVMFWLLIVMMSTISISSYLPFHHTTFLLHVGSCGQQILQQDIMSDALEEFRPEVCQFCMSNI